MPDYTVAHRQPAISILRDVTVEPEAEVVLYWNGSIARNGDGYVPAGGAAVSYAKPLHKSRLWQKGQPFLFGGGFGVGGFGEPGSFDDARGFGLGPFGVGLFGVGASYWTWKPQNLWRNGIYHLVARLRDSLGNEQATAVADITIEVAAPPRPCPAAWIVSNTSTKVTIAWRHSPEFEAV